jgi:hypothetical protein
LVNELQNIFESKKELLENGSFTFTPSRLERAAELPCRADSETPRDGRFLCGGQYILAQILSTIILTMRIYDYGRGALPMIWSARFPQRRTDGAICAV